MSTSSRRHRTLELGAAGAFLLTTATAPGAWALSPAAAGDVAPVAQGEVTFDCLLLPFQSAFRYQGTVSVAGPRDFVPGETVEVVGRFPKIPGIAPVAIEGGTMRATAHATVGGEELELKATHTVNSPPKQEVAMPRMTGQVTLADPSASVELTGFEFVFDKMMGIVISADCEATDGAKLGAMRADAPGRGDAQGPGKSKDATQAVAATTDGTPPLVLGGGALAVLAAGVLLWFARRARRV